MTQYTAQVTNETSYLTVSTLETEYKRNTNRGNKSDIFSTCQKEPAVCNEIFTLYGLIKYYI